MKEGNYHEPVLLREVIDYLHIEKSGKYVDATVGAGGHSFEILKRGGDVLGIDQDPKILEIARKKLSFACPKLLHANFSAVKDLAIKENFAPVDGILFDLGISSVHFDDKQRGFSFKNPEAYLDMRLDPKGQGVKASDLVNSLGLDQLTSLFELGMNRFEARNLSKKIIDFRKEKKIETVSDFLLAGKFHHKRRFSNRKVMHPATRAFMALRIAVNTELKNLEEGLKGGFEILKQKGRMAVISFHSGEDKIVKNYFRNLSMSGKAKLVTKRPTKPSEEEIMKNPRSGSAILRVIERIK